MYEQRIGSIKEIAERRHGEPIKFLSLPKMGPLGSQAGNEKKMMVVNYEQLLRTVFPCFHGQIFFSFNFFYIVRSALKSCLIQK